MTTKTKPKHCRRNDLFANKFKLEKNEAGFRWLCLANDLSVEIAFPSFWVFSNQELLKITATVSIDVSSVAEAKLALKELKMKKKELQIKKKETSEQIRHIRASYTDMVQRQG